MKKGSAFFGSPVTFGFRLVCLTIVHLFAFVLAAQLAGVSSQPATSPTSLTDNDTEAGQTIKPVMPDDEPKTNSGKSKGTSQADQAKLFGLVSLVCLMNSAAMIFWIQRCTLRGFRLATTVFVVFFSCMTIMPQSETFFFLRNSESIIRTATVMGLCVSVAFAIATVPLFWRMQSPGIASVTSMLDGLTLSGFLRRLILCSVVYVVLYVVFGYYVAWQNPELRALYGGAKNSMPGFWEHVLAPPVSNRVIPLQFVRGIVWTVLCLGMIRFSFGSRWSLAIVVGLVLAIVMNSQLLLPNPIMSANVRLTHLLETASSNFLFGIICVGVLTRKPLKKHQSLQADSAR